MRTLSEIVHQKLESLLNEEKSVSNTVKQMAKLLGHAIMENMRRTEGKRNHLNLWVKENNINVSLSEIDDRLGTVRVNYIVYMCQDKRQFNDYIVNGNIQANSSYDNETDSMRIVTGYYGEELDKDFYEAIMHELTHLYQYHIGLEKRVDLYDKAVRLTQTEDSTKWKVGYAIYCTFPHEQDAFAHQFYQFLKSNENHRLSFEFFTSRFANYVHFIKSYDFIWKNKKDRTVIDAIKSLGYDPKDYFKRLYFGKQRFERKLRNAYDYYQMERTNQNDISEGKINAFSKRWFLLDEGLDDLKFGIESIYKYFK